MKKLFVNAIFFTIILFFLYAIPSVSAYTITNMTVSPSGIQTDGTPVSIISYIDFTPSNEVTFPSGGELQMNSDLKDPGWDWTLILNGVENPRPHTTGSMLSLSGFELSYPSWVNESVRLTLQGTIPVNSSPSQNLIKIQQLDSNGNIISSSIYRRDMPVTPTPTQPTPTPTPSYGSISISSTPSGAKVYLDNEYKGLTPLTMENIVNGNHIVLVKLAGYQDWTQNVGVLANSTSFSATLLALTTTTTTATTAPITTAITTKPTTIATTIQTTVPTTEPTTIPITTIPTPTKKPTTKKTFTPIPTETQTPESPIGIEVVLVAVCLSGLFFVKKQ
jgi:hypothetical protein